jgi:CRISPR system Cascade subunit CasA
MRPADVTAGIADDPIVAIAWGRPDFDATTREFLIGLLATACRFEARDGWRRWFNTPPLPEKLHAAFSPLAEAFAVDGTGPRFGQDIEELASDPEAAAQLLIDAPGVNTLKNNLDHFIRRGRVEVLSRKAAAIALLTLQTYAPKGGRGHRTSVRGGGPLTTLLVPGTENDSAPVPLWRTLWLNVPRPEGEEGDALPVLQPQRVFPWLAPTRVSDRDLKTTPQDVDPLQAFWGMPRRIRLDLEHNSDGRPCDLTGEVDEVVVRTYRARPHGAKYEAFVHPLSPHYKSKKTDHEWVPLHGQPGRVGYRHWVGFVVDDGQSGLKVPASVVTEATKRLGDRRMSTPVRFGARLLASGYDMDNMKARDFIESEMPLHLVRGEIFEEYSRTVDMMVSGAREAAYILRTAIRRGLFGNNAPKSGGPIALARDGFWDRSERDLREVLRLLAKGLEDADLAEGPRIREAARQGWLERLRHRTEDLFDEVVPQTDLDALDLKALGHRVAARRALRLALRGHGKPGAALFKALDLRLPEAKKSRRRVPA